MRDLKYLAAYINPALATTGLLLGGGYSWMNVIFVFVLVPLFDQLGPESEENVSDSERSEKLKRRLFDWLLYLNVPILYAVLGVFIWQLHSSIMTPFELTGHIISVGIVIGTCGINVGHELGHRSKLSDQIMAWMLLLPALYQHFFVEHNRGHHRHVGTPLDPASAVKGISVYAFWFQSVTGGFISAWNIERDRLHSLGVFVLSARNYMLWFSLIQLIYVSAVFLILGFPYGFFVLAAGLVGVLLLETINYLEHYGLRRKQLENGRYERVRPIHSWNANFSFGRIVLYELTRHSDHHYKASKKYQILDHHDESPQLPLGYPAMILVSLVPPLWFSMMDPRIPKEPELNPAYPAS